MANRLLWITSCVWLWMSACTFDNEEETFPAEDGEVGCQTANISYLTDVLPIIRANCYVCHDDDNFNTLGSGIDLEGYDDLKIYVDNERFFGSINREQNFSPMPRGAPKLDQCDLDKIKSWIDAGALNN